MSDEPEKSAPQELSERVTTWPYLVRIELLWTIVAMIILTVWSIVVDAPLEMPANPNRTPDPSKAPWYFLGLQEMLVYFDPWIAGVMVPLLIIAGLIAIPYLDTNPRGNGYYTWRERRFAISVFLFGFVGLWVLPIIVGVFCRGPGWGWYWPWESWEVAHVPDLALVNLSDLFGVPDGTPAMIFGGVVVAAWYVPAVVYWFWRRRTAALRSLGVWRYAITAWLLLTMLAMPAKIALRLAFDVRYVWLTPWFGV